MGVSAATGASPQAEEGLRFADPAHPGVLWEVVQATPEDVNEPIYARRVRDGRLFHYHHDGWTWAWRHGYLTAA